MCKFWPMIMSKFELSPWCDANRILSKTADILKDQDLHIEEAQRLLTQDDIADLGLTKNKLLSKAVNGLRAPDLPPNLANTKPIKKTALRKTKV